MSYEDEQNKDEIYATQRAYNYMVIMRMWKYLYKSYGQNITTIGNKSIYSVLGRSKDSIRTIVRIDYQYCNQKDKIEKNAKEVEKRTGIAKEYLTGEKLIELEGLIKKDEIDKYMETREVFGEIYEMYKQYGGTQLTSSEKKKINNIYNSLNKKSQQKVITKAIKFKKSLAQLDVYEEEVKRFEQKVFDCMEDFFAKSIEHGDNGVTDIEKLRYFMKYKKRLSAISQSDIENIKKQLMETRTGDFLALGDNLKPYINVLEKHLKLAKAVYIVAVDCGNIKES